MHLCNPVTKAVHNKIAYYRMIAVYCISAAGKIFVILHVAFCKMIVNVVLNSLKLIRRTVFVAFCRMVVNYIKNNLDAGFVKFLYKLLEFPDTSTGCFIRRITLFRRKKSDCTVTPEILETFPCLWIYISIFVFVKFIKWKELDGGNSKFF